MAIPSKGRCLALAQDSALIAFWLVGLNKLMRQSRERVGLQGHAEIKKWTNKNVKLNVYIFGCVYGDGRIFVEEHWPTDRIIILTCLW
jgi:hypothetical protein